MLPKAALFDMDGLLLDTERVAQASFVDAVRPLRVPEPQAQAMFVQMVGLSNAQNTRQLVDFLPAGTDIDALRGRWRDGFAARIAEDVPLRPHVPEVIEGLSSAGVTMAVVTSTATEPARAQLQRVGLLEAFVTVIGGDAVAAHKPDPAPYLAGAKAIDVSPQACVAFEDSDPGVHAATAAGCKVWQIPDLRAEGQAFPALGQGMARDLRQAVLEAGLMD